MTYVLGLTGSIGMGKSTTAKMFAAQGVPVWDADLVVRSLYAPGGAAVELVKLHYPSAMDGAAVSRSKLRELIAKNPEVLDHLNTLVHPLVGADRQKFLSMATSTIVLLDIPLLFETGSDALCNGVVVVSVDETEQRRRVLARGEMTEQDFSLILKRQMPDAEKRAKATWIIPTDTLDGARQHVKDILQQIRGTLHA